MCVFPQPFSFGQLIFPWTVPQWGQPKENSQRDSNEQTSLFIPMLVYHCVLKPATSHGCPRPAGDLLGLYAAFPGKKGSFWSLQQFKLNRYSCESILHCLVVRNAVFPNTRRINPAHSVGVQRRRYRGVRQRAHSHAFPGSSVRLVGGHLL